MIYTLSHFFMCHRTRLPQQVVTKHYSSIRAATILSSIVTMRIRPRRQPHFPSRFSQHDNSPLATTKWSSYLPFQARVCRWPPRRSCGLIRKRVRHASPSTRTLDYLSTRRPYVLSINNPFAYSIRTPFSCPLYINSDVADKERWHLPVSCVPETNSYRDWKVPMP